MKKILIFLVVIALFTTTVCAKEPEDEIFSEISSELNGFKEALPDDVINFLPKEIWIGDFSSLLDSGLEEKNFINLVIDYIFLGLGDVIKSFASIIVVVLICSILNMLEKTSETMKSTFSLCAGLLISLSVFAITVNLLKSVTSFMKLLCTVMKTFIPIMSVMYIMTGNITSGAVSNASMLLFITFIEQFLVSFLSPIISISICFCCMRVLGNGIDFSGLSKAFKTTFSSILVFVMSILMFVLSTKNVLAQSTDSVSIKTAKFAISSFIPIVGASINDALRTVISSMGLIKNACGIIAIIAIVILILPPIISLLLSKLSFSILSGICKCVSCSNESAIIDEANSICSFLLAIICCTSVLFIFALTLFIKAAVVGV